MARSSRNRPTDAELDILRVLWRAGPATVRDVHDTLGPSRGVGYTTVLKLMQLMLAKKLLSRDERRRTHVYAARVPQEQTQRQIVADVLDRVFGGSARALVLQALSSKKVTKAELAELRDLIDQFSLSEGAAGGDSHPTQGGRT